MKAHEVLKILNISRATLTRYVKLGKIKAVKNEFSRYTYDPKSVYKLLNGSPKVDVIYARVSTHKQKNQLTNQVEKITEYCNNNNINIDKEYKDISSGLSLDRKNFEILLNRIFNYQINSVIITNKDRLFRMSFKTLEQLFLKYGTTIVCINEIDKKTEEQELLDDLISIIHCFSMKMYSKRRKTKMTIIKNDLNLEKQIK